MTVNKVRRNGSYAPLSAHYYKDDAIDEAGEAAELLYVRGLAFCADVLSDGFISDRQLVRFVGVGMFDARDRADRLVEVGLWERVEGGYGVRSWLTWNRSRAEITDALVKDRGRKASSGADSESTRPEPDPPSGGGRRTDRIPNGIRADSAPGPDGGPVGIPPRARTPRHSTPRNSTPSQATPADAALLDLADVPAAPPPGFEDFWKLYPKKVKKQGAQDSWSSKVVKAKVSPELVLAALRAHIVSWQQNRQYPKFVPDPTTWLNGRRWQDELGPPLAAVSGDGGYQPWSNYPDQSVYDEPMVPTKESR
jgi:hypothetical protein